MVLVFVLFKMAQLIKMHHLSFVLIINVVISVEFYQSVKL